jgi:hypothetical protein
MVMRNVVVTIVLSKPRNGAVFLAAWTSTFHWRGNVQAMLGLSGIIHMYGTL